MSLGLLVTNGLRAGQLIPVVGVSLMIGRGPQCHVRPSSPAVAQRHCLMLVRDKRVFLRDLGSNTGTFLNDRQLRGEIELQDGDMLRVGPLSFVVQFGDDALEHGQQSADLAASAVTNVARTSPPSSPAENDVGLGQETPSSATVTRIIRKGRPTLSTGDGRETSPVRPATVTRVIRKGRPPFAAEDEVVDLGQEAAPARRPATVTQVIRKGRRSLQVVEDAVDLGQQTGSHRQAAVTQLIRRRPLSPPPADAVVTQTSAHAGHLPTAASTTSDEYVDLASPGINHLCETAETQVMPAVAPSNEPGEQQVGSRPPLSRGRLTQIIRGSRRGHKASRTQPEDPGATILASPSLAEADFRPTAEHALPPLAPEPLPTSDFEVSTAVPSQATEEGATSAVDAYLRAIQAVEEGEQAAVPPTAVDHESHAASVLLSDEENLEPSAPEPDEESYQALTPIPTEVRESPQAAGKPPGPPVVAAAKDNSVRRSHAEAWERTEEVAPAATPEATGELKQANLELACPNCNCPGQLPWGRMGSLLCCSRCWCWYRIAADGKLRQEKAPKFGKASLRFHKRGSPGHSMEVTPAVMQKRRRAWKTGRIKFAGISIDDSIVIWAIVAYMIGLTVFIVKFY